MYIDSTLVPKVKQSREKAKELILYSNFMIVLTLLLTFRNIMERNKVRRYRVAAEDSIEHI